MSHVVKIEFIWVFLKSEGTAMQIKKLQRSDCFDKKTKTPLSDVAIKEWRHNSSSVLEWRFFLSLKDFSRRGYLHLNDFD